MYVIMLVYTVITGVYIVCAVIVTMVECVHCRDINSYDDRVYIMHNSLSYQ